MNAARSESGQPYEGQRKRGLRRSMNGFSTDSSSGFVHSDGKARSAQLAAHALDKKRPDHWKPRTQRAPATYQQIAHGAIPAICAHCECLEWINGSTRKPYEMGLLSIHQQKAHRVFHNSCIQSGTVIPRCGNSALPSGHPPALPASAAGSPAAGSRRPRARQPGRCPSRRCGRQPAR